jgi:hypothetical protein
LGQDDPEIVFGFSDLMYIPATLAKTLAAPLAVYSKHEVFVELTWPNLVKHYVDPADRVLLNTENHVLYDHGHTDWQRLYSRALHGIHPVKWMIEDNMAAAQRLLTEDA